MLGNAFLTAWGIVRFEFGWIPKGPKFAILSKPGLYGPVVLSQDFSCLSWKCGTLALQLPSYYCLLDCSCAFGWIRPKVRNWPILINNIWAGAHGWGWMDVDVSRMRKPCEPKIRQFAPKQQGYPAKIRVFQTRAKKREQITPAPSQTHSFIRDAH